MLNRRTLSHGTRGLANAHRLAPHMVDCEPITWFRRHDTVRRSKRVGFLIGLAGGGSVGLLAQALAISL
jgi:hypothetical protein